MMIGLIEIRRRRFQFLLIATIVTLISYLVLMINGLGVGLNALAGSALKNFDADAIAYADEAGLSVFRSELSKETIADRYRSAGEGGGAARLRRREPQTSDGKVKSAAFLGVDPGSGAEPKTSRGRQLQAGDRRSLLADVSFLRSTGKRVGDVVDVSFRLSIEKFTIVGEVDHRRPSLQPLRIVNVAMAQSTLASSSVALRVWPPPTAQSTPILPASRSRLPRLCLGLSRVDVPARQEVCSAGSGGN